LTRIRSFKGRIFINTPPAIEIKKRSWTDNPRQDAIPDRGLTRLSKSAPSLRQSVEPRKTIVTSGQKSRRREFFFHDP